ncbi:hypothetical protein [Lactococcus petauri]|uniref:Uncharacterized protein n=1 Tax=Lactococcus petauri TaxID=1940789 RepID=A0A252CAF3_9LACT|nr:hypothetical protein [Lactococcus petauri]OUK02759.1 hypothetical protein BZZ03_11225 [Lactococcus petauri]
MENYNDFTETDVQNFETELSKIIQEVEENKKKQDILIQENNQLRAESIQLKANEARYAMTLEENFKLKKELETRSSLGLSEKDLAEVMLDAKRVANDIIQKSKDEALKIEQENQKILNEIKLEGNILKDNILNLKFKINQDIDQWVQNIEQVIDGREENLS